MELSNLDIWKRRIEDQRNSGLAITRWCKENHLSEHAFYSWRKRIRESGREAISVATFAEVSVSTQSIPSSEVGLQVLWNNLQLTIHCKEDVELAAALIGKLQNQC